MDERRRESSPHPPHISVVTEGLISKVITFHLPPDCDPDFMTEEPEGGGEKGTGQYSVTLCQRDSASLEVICTKST